MLTPCRDELVICGQQLVMQVAKNESAKHMYLNYNTFGLSLIFTRTVIDTLTPLSTSSSKPLTRIQFLPQKKAHCVSTTIINLLILFGK
jgi:hypothetical protein